MKELTVQFKNSICYSIIQNLDIEEFKLYYTNHTAKDTADKFNIDKKYIYRILDYLELPKHSNSYAQKLKFQNELNYEKLRKKHKPMSEETKSHYKGRIPHNKGKNKYNYKPLAEASIKLQGRPLHGDIWNKGKTKETDERVANYALKLVNHEWFVKDKDDWLNKQYATKTKNNSFNSSKPEDNLYKELCNTYGIDDVKRQYSIDIRYPFNCDFYIESEDLFIELNAHWSHGGHPFDETNLDDIYKLEQWKEKAKLSKYYKNAIKVWTVLDPLKIKTAKDNNLNINFIYIEED